MNLVNIKNLQQKLNFLKNFASHIALLLVVSFLIPSSVFGPHGAEAEQIYTQAKVQTIQVVSQVREVAVKVVASAVSGCSVATAGVTTFVQDQANLNLNNSAACSALEVANIKINAAISVRELPKQTSSVVVSLPGSRFQSAFETHVPPQPLSVVTLVIFFVVAALYEERKRFKELKVLKNTSEAYFRQPVLAELNVWRC